MRISGDGRRIVHSRFHTGPEDDPEADVREVWIRQVATGEIEYYRLPGARPGFDELPGRFDREGFAPP